MSAPAVVPITGTTEPAEAPAAAPGKRTTKTAAGSHIRLIFLLARQVRVVLSLPNVIGGHGKLGPKKSLAERPCPGLYGLFRYRLRRGVCNRLAPGFQRRPLEYGLAAHIGGGLGEGRLAASLNGGFPCPAQSLPAPPSTFPPPPRSIREPPHAMPTAANTPRAVAAS